MKVDEVYIKMIERGLRLNKICTKVNKGYIKNC